MGELTIGEVARYAGVRTSAIRYYERAGLLESPERIGGRRRYDSEVLTRLALVRMVQEAGFSIDEIRTLLGGFPDGTPPSVRWQELARKKLPEVNAMIHRMEVVRRVLEESLQCDCLTLDACAALGWQHGIVEGTPPILTFIDESNRMIDAGRG